jgi:PhnB protein
MRSNPYLSFNGQCEEAFRFYEACLGGKIAMLMTYGTSPMAGQAPPEWHGKVLHVTFHLGESVLQGSDALPGHYVKPQGFSVALSMDDPAEAERVFDALAYEGTVELPLQQTFWAQRFGILVDRFGIPWTMNCAAPM